VEVTDMMTTQEDQVALFLATLDDQTFDEAMANLERDAVMYGWSRAVVRKAAASIRLRAVTI
jgi:hypothetical protein